MRHRGFITSFFPPFILFKPPAMELGFATALQALTDDVGIYISGRLRYILLHKGPNEFPPKDLSDSLVTDCEQVISVIAEAWRSKPIQVKWDIEDYIKDIGPRPTGISFRSGSSYNLLMGISGRVMLMEDALLRKYPPAFPTEDEVVEDRPVVVRDVRGRHLAWYLPGAMSDELQVNLNP